VGASAAEQRAEAARLERMGLTRADIDAAQAIATELSELAESLQMVTDAADLESAHVQKLVSDMDEAYIQAQAMMIAGDEVAARKYLERRESAREQLEVARANEEAARDRVAQVSAAGKALAARAAEMQALVSRTVTASAARRLDNIDQDGRARISSFEQDGSPPEDPLDSLDPIEARFRKLEREGGQ
jgi:hypothetical protein